MNSYQDAVIFLEKLGLKSRKDWNNYIEGKFKGLQKPATIPDDPEQYYENIGWVSWNHFFSANKFRKKSVEKRKI